MARRPEEHETTEKVKQQIGPLEATMSHFFYMDTKDATKVLRWIGAVGPTGF
jgi:hypothetical protein